VVLLLGGFMTEMQVHNAVYILNLTPRPRDLPPSPHRQTAVANRTNSIFDKSQSSLLSEAWWSRGPNLCVGRGLGTALWCPQHRHVVLLGGLGPPLPSAVHQTSESLKPRHEIEVFDLAKFRTDGKAKWYGVWL
jgi:hypothetical protein